MTSVAPGRSLGPRAKQSFAVNFQKSPQRSATYGLIRGRTPVPGNPPHDAVPPKQQIPRLGERATRGGFGATGGSTGLEPDERNPMSESVPDSDPAATPYGGMLREIPFQVHEIPEPPECEACKSKMQANALVFMEGPRWEFGCLTCERAQWIPLEVILP